MKSQRLVVNLSAGSNGRLGDNRSSSKAINDSLSTRLWPDMTISSASKPHYSAPVTYFYMVFHFNAGELSHSTKIMNKKHV